MLKNYLKIAFRNLYFNKTQTMIKIAGLAIALCVSLAIFSWIKFELSYDSFHKDADHIYRLVLENDMITSPPGFKKIFNDIPGIEHSVRLFKAGFLGETQRVTNGNKIYTNDEIYYADDDFFNVFSFPLMMGNPGNILKKNNAVVITEMTARKYFGDNNPIGKTLLIGDNNELEVTGVMKNIPANSHFHFDILITLKNHPWWTNFDRINLGSMWIFPTYFKINKQTNIAAVLQKINQAVQPHPYKPEVIGFQKLKDIHLYSAFSRELEANGDIYYIYLFSIAGMLIIIMSCINYINLTTALSFRRAKEVGIRKTVGAAKFHLISQFIGESIIISLIAFILSLILLEVMNPIFASIIGVNFFSGILHEGLIVAVAFLSTLIIGVLTGLLPAIVLAKHNIINSIKSGLSASHKKVGWRSVLVVFQFCVSIILIACSFTIYNQMQYIRNKKLGYNKDQVLILNLGRSLSANKIEVFKKTIAVNSNVTDVTAGSQLPTNIITGEGVNTKDGKRYESYCMSVDNNFFKTLDIKIKKGKERIEKLTREQNSDWKTFKNNFVVNQTFLKTAGIELDDTENQTLIIRHGNMEPGPIIGVVEDFHFESLHNPIRPLVFEFTPVVQWGNAYLLIKVSSQNIPATLNYIKQQWTHVADGLPFDYSFLDENYNSLYQSETRTGNLFTVFTLVSIFIIILGLLGLIAFIVGQKTKEIGIRKVLGASIPEIILLLSKEFTKWVLLANIIAVPVAYFVMNNWLEDFAYRIEINWWIFVLSGLTALVIALATISFQAVKAALANPVEALRYE